MTYIINILSLLVISYLLLLRCLPPHHHHLSACISVYRPPNALGYNRVDLAPNFLAHNLRRTRKMPQERAFRPYDVCCELWEDEESFFDVRITNEE